MNILFVCTGNTCRSPMAAALLQEMARKEGIEMR
ncbi:MAG: low molecular weight protein arginine phosphatase, partial [Tissierellia bacterium]|nr:low molecular weight protein arginine phosphatase [Tissierellia bacterium]